MRALDPDLIERFRRDLRAAAGAEASGPIALAVSGGPDSMAMLALTHAGFPGQAIAATVDHRLRPEAADEAAMVAAACAGLGVPHATLRPALPVAGASIQAQAREARYALLGDWAARQGATLLLTAHHADDQAETFLMRAARGSGVAGLASVRVRRMFDAAGGLAVLRPLLGWRRTELRDVAIGSGLPFIDDPSNRDDTHDRTRFRRLFEETPWLDPVSVARSAWHVAEAEEALRVMARLLWTQRATRADQGYVVDVAGLPRELRRRLSRRAVGEVRRMADIAEPAWSDAANIEPLLDSLEAGFGATQAGVMATPKGNSWLFRPAPPRRSH